MRWCRLLARQVSYQLTASGVIGLEEMQALKLELVWDFHESRRFLWLRFTFYRTLSAYFKSCKLPVAS